MAGVEVSIVTPTYNRANLLSRTWQSIKDQHIDFEWIVVDDGSTDNTRDIIAGFKDQRISYLSLPNNRGVNVARNRGISASSGKYIVLLDSDDELFPGSLEHMVQLMNNAAPEIGAAVFACVVAATGKQIAELPNGKVLNEYDVICKDELYAGSEKILVYRKEVFDNNLLPEDLSGCEAVFLYRMSRKWKFLMINKPMRVYHRQEDNASSADRIIARSYDFAKLHEMIINDHGDLLEKNRKMLITILKKALYRYAVSKRTPDAWRLYKLILKQPVTLIDIFSATIYLMLSVYGAPQFEKWRINRINDKLTSTGK